MKASAFFLRLDARTLAHSSHWCPSPSSGMHVLHLWSSSEIGAPAGLCLPDFSQLVGIEVQ
eukprot:518052-Prorocentrum_lima.AAC.1